MTSLTVSFPGGKRVDAAFAGFVVKTDQPREKGGEGSAPSPFELFLASIATCAGFYVKGYCDTRGLATEGLGVEMRVEQDADTHMVRRLELQIRVPDGFPEKHRDGVLRAAGLCTVKKHLEQPPAFELRVVSRVESPALIA